METRPGVHPSVDILQALAKGRMDDRAIETLLNHLADCTSCCLKLTAMTSDEFLKQLRDSHGRSANPLESTVAYQATCLPKAAAPLSGKPAPTSDLPPELAGHSQYEIVRELGRGGMGVVYLARNKLMARFEVLKVVNKDLLARPGVAERFLREIQSAALLNHPNVVKAYSALQLAGSLALAMEYVEGEDLFKVVKEGGPLSVGHACHYTREAALGLQHAFEKKMVHRDIKPQNLILARDGPKHIVKVLDFGLAKVFREGSDQRELTGSGVVLGTPHYMAPEQALGASHIDIRADIYSLGCTLYLLLTGAPPFKGKNVYEILHAQQTLEAPALSSVRSEIPQKLAMVVSKMMAKAPEQRYQTPFEAAQALAPFIKQNPKPLTANEPPAPMAILVKPKPQAPPAAPSPAKYWSPPQGISLFAKLRMCRNAGSAPSLITMPFKKQKWVLGAITLGMALLGTFVVIGLVCLWAGGRNTDSGDKKVVISQPMIPAVEVDAQQIVSRTLPSLKLVRIPAKGMTFTMGSPPGEKDRRNDETAHEVTLSADYYLGVTTVTVGQFAAFVKDTGYKTEAEKGDGGSAWNEDKRIWEKDKKYSWQNPGFVQTDDHPVVEVGLNDAVTFCEWLSRKDERAYSLPTGAQWEFACRAGTKTAYSFGDNPEKLGDYAWFSGNSGSAAHAVATKMANPWGLYDMHGNVSQWCADWYGAYPKTALTDPQGPQEGSGRVSHGSSWISIPQRCRSANRFRDDLSYRSSVLGFRLALSPEMGQPAPKGSGEVRGPLPAKVTADAQQILSQTLPSLKLAHIPAKGKTFTMGSPPGEKDRKNDETAHEVTLSADYYLGVTSVTRGQFAAFVKDVGYQTDEEKAGGQSTWRNPGFEQTDDHPVVCVSHNDAVAFCQWLSRKDGKVYRLPTKAEGEYACRAGTKTAYFFGNDATMLGDYAWFKGNSGGGTHAVGTKNPNPWGLYDMNGNARQWCADWYGEYPTGAVEDPQGPKEGSLRLTRGGGWDALPRNLRSANHGLKHLPSFRVNKLGFRLAVSVR